jgi:hypothetical protein
VLTLVVCRRFALAGKPLQAIAKRARRANASAQLQIGTLVALWARALAPRAS